MIRWAILEEGTNKVLSITYSDTRPQNGVKGQDSSCRVGYFWNGWTFDAPKWTALQFLNRFTDSELMDIRSKSVSDPIMWKFLTFATAAQEVISNDPVTVAGMDYLVLTGVLSQTRRNEILEGA